MIIAIRQFVDSIMNLVRWFPTIWKDRDWDSYYTYEVLKSKLCHIRDHFEYHNNHTMLKNLKLCIKLLDRVQNEYYLMEWNEYSTVEHTLVKDAKSNLSTINMHVVEERFDDYFSKYKRTSALLLSERGRKEVVFGTDTKMHFAMSVGVYNHKKAKSILFKVLSDNIERWCI